MPTTTPPLSTRSPGHGNELLRRPRARARRAPARLAAVAVIAALALSGCELRLETPAPTVPVAGAIERARAGAVTDALALRALADAASPGTDPTVAAVLTRVADSATTHVTELGGVYVSGLGGPTSSPTATATPTRPGVREVLDRLESAASRSRDSAVSVSDGDLARLLASLTLSRLQDARALAAAAGLPGPDAGTTAAPTSAASTDVPVGVSPPRSEVTQIVLAEDQAGFAEEVAAAWIDGPARAELLARAAGHRARARAWAVHAGIASTGTDPRRVAYSLPNDLHDAATAGALVATVETALTTAYTTMLSSVRASAPEPTTATATGTATATATATATSTGTTTPPVPVPTSPVPDPSGGTPSSTGGPSAPPPDGGRGALLERADDAWSTAVAWGAAPTALPGFGTPASNG